jgi:hypothetical protein
VKPEFKNSPQRDAYQEEWKQNIERQLTFHMYFLVDPAAARPDRCSGWTRTQHPYPLSCSRHLS